MSSFNNFCAPPSASSNALPEYIISFRDPVIDPTKSCPFDVSDLNLVFSDIPCTSGVRVERQFPILMSHLAPANFETTSDWPRIEETIKGFFDSKDIVYSLPINTAIFSVHKVPGDSNLEFGVFCYPKENNTSFVIEFRRIHGDAFVLSKLFSELKAKFGVDNTASASSSASPSDSSNASSNAVFARLCINL